MVIFLKQLLCIIIGLGSGQVISGAVFAFITVIGIVPNMAKKTKTTKYVKFYETVLIIGGVLGGFLHFYDFHIPIGIMGVIICSLALGIFVGALAASLAEVLNVIPILTKRLNVKKGLFYFILALAIGKMTGSLLYYNINGFFKPM